MFNKPSKALKPDAQAFDEVRIVTVPRYKQSGMSGDEWRISATIQFYRKGKLICEEHSGDVEHACNFAGWYYSNAVSNGNGHFAGEPGICDQEGCAALATVTLKLKSRYCREGHKHDTCRVEYRQFCDQHKTRGNCGLDDADINYEPMESP